MEGYNNLSEIESNLEYLAELELEVAVDNAERTYYYYRSEEMASRTVADPYGPSEIPEKAISVAGTKGTTFCVTYHNEEDDTWESFDIEGRGEAFEKADSIAKQMYD